MEEKVVVIAVLVEDEGRVVESIVLPEVEKLLVDVEASSVERVVDNGIGELLKSEVMVVILATGALRVMLALKHNS